MLCRSQHVANYAGSTIQVAATNADGAYFVAISVDNAVKVLLFNADGSFDKKLEKPFKRGKKH
ncbi:hypothetical protein LZG73_04200 [Dyadobacter sp. CY326]|nr:hypothetical protein [Dyadobacter sp. CY326]